MVNAEAGFWNWIKKHFIKQKPRKSKEASRAAFWKYKKYERKCRRTRNFWICRKKRRLWREYKIARNY
jgi:hypothetical protein